MTSENNFFNESFFEDIAVADKKSVTADFAEDAFQTSITYSQYRNYIKKQLNDLIPLLSVDNKTITDKVARLLYNESARSLSTVVNATEEFLNFAEPDKDFVFWLIMAHQRKDWRAKRQQRESKNDFQVELVKHFVKNGSIVDVVMVFSHNHYLPALNDVTKRGTWSHDELDTILNSFPHYKTKSSIVRSIYPSGFGSISDAEVEVLRKHYAIPALNSDLVKNKAIERFNFQPNLPYSVYQYSLAFGKRWNPDTIRLEAGFDFASDLSVKIILTEMLERLPSGLEEHVDYLFTELPNYSFESFIHKLTFTQPWMVAPLLLKIIHWVVSANDNGNVRKVEVEDFFKQVGDNRNKVLFSTLVKYLEENAPYFVVAALLKFYCYPLRFVRWTNAEGKLFIARSELTEQVLVDAFSDERIVAFFKEMHGSREGLYLAEKLFKGLGNFSLGVDFPPPAIDVIEPYLGIMFFNEREVAAFGRWKNPTQLEELPDKWIAKLLWETYSSTGGVPYKNR